MGDKRPTIPMELRRKVLVEAGHRCAIPTCRQVITIDIHHIIPWPQCKEHKYENLIALCANCHRLAEEGKIDRKALRIYKANLRYTHDKFSQFEVDILFEAYKLKPQSVLLLPTWAMLLTKRLIDAGYINWRITRSKARVGGTKLNSDHVSITDKGRKFIESLNLKHEDWY